MAANTSTGRIKASATVKRELRHTLNKYAAQLAEKALAKAMTGDPTAMLAASNLLIAANAGQPK
jgi:hypothetical protein